MRPSASEITLVDEMPDDDVTEFTIGDPFWVMESLADLYSDRVAAFIREYSTNAYDAHVEAGVTKPIEVTLPSDWNSSVFSIRDYGNGMSAKTLREVYTKFGDSTKRESDDANGMLGFGCKAAIAYVPSFTVVSIHNGVESTAVISKTSRSINLKIVAQRPTTEPSGTRVDITVRDIAEVARKASDFYRFWHPGTVKVNGVEPKQSVGRKIYEGLYYSEEFNNSYVVMGNVAYRIDNPASLFNNVGINHINFVAYVPIGAVNFSNSREALKYTDKTKAALQAIVTDFESHLLTSARKEIVDAKNHTEAREAWKRWVREFGQTSFASLTYKGDAFTDSFPVRAWRYGSRYTRGTMLVNRWDLDAMPHTLLITDFDNGEPGSGHKRKAREYVNHKNFTAYSILFTSEKKIQSPFFTGVNTVSWTDLLATIPKKVRVPGQFTPANAGRVKGSWDYWTSKGWNSEKPLPTSGKVYYITLQDEKRVDTKGALGFMGLHDASVVVVPANRQAKFLRENPTIEEFLTFAKTKVHLDENKFVSREYRDLMEISGNTREWLSKLPLSEIKDPGLTKNADLIKRQHAIAKPIDDNRRLANALGMRYALTKYFGSKSYAIHTKYPLLSNYPEHIKHAVIYINAVHAAKNY